jgi:hypothetical protein
MGCDFTLPFTTTAWDNLEIKPQVPDLPDFSDSPIFSENGEFTLGCGSIPCSIPCRTICVEVKCGGLDMPCCCLELLGGKIYAVGNGYVTAPTTIDVGDGCGVATILLNGLPPPVFVNDCEEIVVTITDLMGTFFGSCPCICTCQQIDIKCSPCTPLTFAARPLWKRKVDPRTGKTKLNPNTGKPIILLNKNELLRRVKQRIKQSKRGDKK